MSQRLHDRLGIYALPGRVADPARAPQEAAAAEALGLGTVWLSDRRDMKEGAVLCGAMAQATSSIRIGTACTHVLTRHPQVIAAIGATMQGLSGGRFRLGFGRSVPLSYTAMGLTPPTTEALRNNPRILRQLWAGEAVTYSGPLGSFSGLRLSARYDGPPPELLLAAGGPRTLAMAGEVYDGLFLEPCLSPEAVGAAVGVAKAAAARTGRDPDGLHVIPAVIVAADQPDEVVMTIAGGRMVTYLQVTGYGDRKVELNGWDPAVLDAVRDHPRFEGHGREFAYADSNFTLDQLAEVAQAIPFEYIRHANAVGTAVEVQAKLQQYFDAGATEILVHGSSPDQLGPFLATVDPI